MTALHADPRHIHRQHIIEALYARTYEGTNLPKLDEYEEDVLHNIEKNSDAINRYIDTYAETFDHTRMSRIDYAILCLGMYELFLSKDRQPYKVVINEAIELSKEFGSTGTPKLVNGILGKAAENERAKKGA